MRIIPFKSEMIEPVAEFRNRFFSAIPHYPSVTPDEMNVCIKGYHNRKLRRLNPELTLVAEDNNQIIGFAQSAPERTKTGNQSDRGVIRFLAYKRGQRSVGQALLEAVESHLVQHDVRHITAFPRRYCSCITHMTTSLSIHHDHIQAILFANGYNRTNGNVVLDWEKFSIEELQANCPLNFSCELIPREHCKLPGFVMTAFLEEEFVGECRCFPLGHKWVRGECVYGHEYGDWLYISDLDVVEKSQGKGFGKLLLQYSLCEAHNLGYRNASIETDENNGRALTFYCNAGFRAVDWRYDFERKI